MNRPIFLLAIVFLLAGCATVQPSPRAFAWATFDRDRIIDSGAGGLAHRASGRRLTPSDPVRVASISKVAVALGVMRLAEQGRLDLDRDISSWLGWRLRNPAFPDRPISLRLLLSHRSSLVDGIDYAIPLGSSVEAALADPRAFDADHPPGSFFRYSNLNFPVVASAMEAATGQRFDRLMQKLVLSPLGLDACFNWTTCSDAAVARAVTLYEQDGSVLRDDLGGFRPACPVVVLPDAACELSNYRPGVNGALFSPQGGLRASARDLAVIGQLLLNRGRHRGTRFLSEASIDALIGPAWRFDGSNGDTDRGFDCSFGLAVHSLPTPGCRDDLFGEGRAMLGHGGDAYGLRSGLWVNPRTGTGIAFFATGLGENPPRGRSSFRSIEESLARRLGR